MSTTTLQVPAGTSYVAASLLSTVFLLFYQNINVSKARKRAGIKYPQMYAEVAQVEANRDALIFNCAQRAHQNTLENIPIVLISTSLTALTMPLTAASLCGTFTFGRILYTIGYTSGDPAKRNTNGGIMGSLASLGLLLTSTYSVVSMIRKGI